MAGGRHGRYGIDAPFVPALLGGLGFALLVLALVTLLTGGASPGWPLAAVVWELVVGGYLLASAASYVFTALRGRYAVWAELAEGLWLRGSDRVLDMGCGRGAVLLLVAGRLRSGRAVGLDLWAGTDPSGSADATRANAVAEGVSDRVDLCTGDMTAMPFADGEFDVVVSSLAIHTIPSPEGRAAAVAEAVRVLRPGGRLALVDFRHVRDYETLLAGHGVTGLRRRGLGPRFWYGGPWVAATVVTGTKPAAPLGSHGCDRRVESIIHGGGGSAGSRT
jgi:SAM-dependent methyltransferase